jgi:hypothetical protein
MKRLILLSSFAFLNSVHAAKIIGNGADVLDCEKPPAGIPFRFPMLFDFWEAVDMSRVTLSNPDGITYKEKVISFTKRVGRRFPVLAKTIEADFALFEEKKDPKYGREWENIKDSFPKETYASQNGEEAYHGNLPKGCKLVQVANQRPPIFPRHPWFLLNGELWEPKLEADLARALDEFNKSGVAVHEILFRQGLSYGLTDSMGVRDLVGLLFSVELEDLTDADWIAAFLQSYIKYYEIGGLRFPLFSGEPDNCAFAKASGFTRAVGPECTNSSPIRQATIKLHRGSLKVISYADTEDIELSANQVEASVQTRALNFDRQGQSVSVQVQGIMTISSRERSGRSVQYEVDGKIDPMEGTFCGSQAAANQQGRPRSYQTFCGPIEDLFNRTN